MTTRHDSIPNLTQARIARATLVITASILAGFTAFAAVQAPSFERRALTIEYDGDKALPPSIRVEVATPIGADPTGAVEALLRAEDHFGPLCDRGDIEMCHRLLAAYAGVNERP